LLFQSSPSQIILTGLGMIEAEAHVFFVSFSEPGAFEIFSDVV
jgi:hypothetical protein